MCSARSRARKGEAIEHWHDAFVRPSRTPVSGVPPAETIPCHPPSETEHIPWDDLNLRSVSTIARCCHTNIATIPRKSESHFDRVADVYHTNSPHVITTAPMGTSDGDGETRRREDFELRVVHGVRLLDSITAWHPFSRCYCKMYSRSERLTPRSWIRRHEDISRFKDHTHFVAAAPAHPKCANGLHPGKSEAHPTQPIVGHSIPSTE
jgi:hypothetical protein